MTESNEKRLADPSEVDEDVRNDPGKSPTDVNKDSSAAQPVPVTVQDVAPSPDDSPDNSPDDSPDDEGN